MRMKTDSLFYYESEISKKIINSKKIVIYGARIVAKEVANCLMSEPYNCTIDAFMVTSKDGNPNTLFGKPVITIEEGKIIYKDALILVAVLEKYLEEIETCLKLNGFTNIILLGFESDLWSGLRGNYFKHLMNKTEKPYLTLQQELETVPSLGNFEKEVHVYTVKCHMDKQVSYDMKRYNWEIPIQVGADLTNINICEIKDNVGDNISKKNREYCELTALYWIWKNDVSKYAGMGHYRRHFSLNKEMLSKLSNSDIDIVVTIPILNFPNVKVMYGNDHFLEDWEIMLEAIHKISPEYSQTAYKVGNGVYYYAYNMFIARKEILDEYCAWLFSILKYCEQRCLPKESVYQNRCLGFLAERLLTIFVIYNENKWKVVHVEKNFIE